MISFQWDDNALKLLESLGNAKSFIDTFEQQLTYKLGADSVQYMKDQGYMKATAGYHGIVIPTGETERSLSFTVNKTGNGFSVDFTGSFVANYLEDGNGNGPIYPKGRALAIYKRAGQTVDFRSSVAAMGHSKYSNWKPVKFREETVQHVADNLNELSDAYMQELLDKLVGI